MAASMEEYDNDVKATMMKSDKMALAKVKDVTDDALKINGRKDLRDEFHHDNHDTVTNFSETNGDDYGENGTHMKVDDVVSKVYEDEAVKSTSFSVPSKKGNPSKETSLGREDESPLKLRLPTRLLSESKLKVCSIKIKRQDGAIDTIVNRQVLKSSAEGRVNEDRTTNDGAKPQSKELMTTSKSTSLSIEKDTKCNSLLETASETSTSSAVKSTVANTETTPSMTLLTSPSLPSMTASPAEYGVGSLLWARIKGSPYWPSMVTLDPEENQYTRVVERINCKRTKFALREYHVEFFDKVSQRAWVNVHNIIVFESREQFNKLAKQLRNELAGKKKSPAHMRQLKSFKTNAAWHAATKVAEDAVPLEANLRQIHLRNHIWSSSLAQISNGAVKRKRTNVADNLEHEDEEQDSCDDRKSDVDHPSETALSAKRRRLSLEEASNRIKAVPRELLESNRRKLQSGFKLFQLSHLEEFSEEGGNQEKIVTKAWSKLGILERRFYNEQAKKINEELNTKERKVMESNKRLNSHKKAVSNRKKSMTEGTSAEKAKHEGAPSSGTSSVVISKKNGIVSSVAITSPFEEISKPVMSTTSSSSSVTTSTATVAKGELIGVWKRELCCVLCEEVRHQDTGTKDLVRCRGPCQNGYHLSCLNLKLQEVQLSEFKCEECASGRHSCFICKEVLSSEKQEKATKCNIKDCGKFYHLSCLQESGLWPQATIGDRQQLVSCPLHSCHTCAFFNPRCNRFKTKILRCLRCPTAYHANDYCVAAGSVQISATNIVCPKHCIETLMDNKISASWCFVCAQGGSLICCEACPASFHLECLHLTETPNVAYYCDHCLNGRMPLYREIVWAKIGNYRYWPARVVPPTEVPDNIDRLPHEIGEFPIQFCGSKDYYWLSSARCFLYEDGDAERVQQQARNKAAFVKALEEAKELFAAYTKEKEAVEAENAAKIMKFQRPKSYQKLKQNKVYGDCPVYNEKPGALQRCECKPDDKDPCGDDDACLNRIILHECNPAHCPAKERCRNQRFQRREYPPLEVMMASGGNRGFGLFTKTSLRKGEFVVEYVGELITLAECQRRLNSSHRNEEMNFYYMSLDSNRVIDAGPKGNVARFINHSCDPNCVTQKWTVNGDVRVGIFAQKDIAADEELTFNYQLEEIGEERKTCFCGAPSCSGVIGDKKKSSSNETNNNDEGLTKPKGRGRGGGRVATKPRFIKMWEDLCYRCLDGGQLLLCDHKTCPKVYHLECLGEEKVPRQSWKCPWHFCLVCGKNATVFCMHCPNAFCSVHAEAIKCHPTLGNICDEHDDDLNDLLSFIERIGGIQHVLPNPNIPQEQNPLVFQRKLPKNADHTKDVDHLGVSDTVDNCSDQATKNNHGLDNNNHNPIKDKVQRSQKNLGTSTHQGQSVFVSKNDDSLPHNSMEGDVNPEEKNNDISDNITKNNSALSLNAHERDIDVGTTIKTESNVDSRALELMRRLRCKCLELDCSWTGLKTELMEHLSTAHCIDLLNSSIVKNAKALISWPSPKPPSSLPSLKTGTTNAKKPPTRLAAASFNALYGRNGICSRLGTTRNTSKVDHKQPKQRPTPRGSPSSSQSSTSRSLRDKMLWCKFCGMMMRGSNLRRHVRNQHSTLYAELEAIRGPGLVSIDMLQAKDASTLANEASPKDLNNRMRRFHCPYEGCGLLIRPSNFKKHWNGNHGHLPRPDTSHLKRVDPYMINQDEQIGDSVNDEYNLDNMDDDDDDDDVQEGINFEVDVSFDDGEDDEDEFVQLEEELSTDVISAGNDNTEDDDDEEEGMLAIVEDDDETGDGLKLELEED